MSPAQAAERALLRERVLALIEACRAGAREDATRDALLTDLADYQARWVAPYGHFCAQRRPGAWAAPALPTDAFRFARISSRAAGDDLRTFHSSGTTSAARGAHSFADLSLYDAAAQAAARHMLFPDRERMQLLILAPRERELFDSSLSYMLARFLAWFGDAHSTYVWPIDSDSTRALAAELHAARERGAPVALLGTSFAFVHALDALGAQRFSLPPESRIMQTGGFKGRSREVSPRDMRALLTAGFGVDEALIVAEYGMTELSSQLYETTLRDALLAAEPRARRLWAPGWVRVSVIEPERLTPCASGKEGLVRIDDAANLDSVCALQTADLGCLLEGELVLRGRAHGAVARGCSITADQLLGGGSA